MTKRKRLGSKFFSLPRKKRKHSNCPSWWRRRRRRKRRPKLKARRRPTMEAKFKHPPWWIKALRCRPDLKAK